MLNDVILPTTGQYFIRVAGGVDIRVAGGVDDRVQLYSVTLLIEPARGPFLYVDDSIKLEPATDSSFDSPMQARAR